MGSKEFGKRNKDEALSPIRRSSKASKGKKDESISPMEIAQRDERLSPMKEPKDKSKSPHD